MIGLVFCEDYVDDFGCEWFGECECVQLFVFEVGVYGWYYCGYCEGFECVEEYECVCVDGDLDVFVVEDVWCGCVWY